MPVLPQKNVLISFDIATVTGWCCNGVWGIFDLKTKKDESWGMKVIRFGAKLEELYKSTHFTVAVYERPGGRFKNSIITESKLIGKLEEFCELRKINYKGYSAKEIKKFATGNGNASKEKVIEAVREKFGYTGNDDNEADAIALYHLAKTDLLI